MEAGAWLAGTIDSIDFILSGAEPGSALDRKIRDILELDPDDVPVNPEPYMKEASHDG